MSRSHEDVPSDDQRGGFDFGLVKRNALLELKGCAGPKPWKTGTTIAGVIYKV
jgi:20S proteasome subunit beta 2